ncbi:MAG TPA: menaquinone biosynthesis protein [Tepidisphaeraceae bacterium]|jgi:chorismate dehydratase
MHRIGCVSYLNAKPLIFGLEQQPDIQLDLEVPAKLLDGLLAKRFEVALLPVIDYQRMENLALLPAGGIGSEDETLTVRIFSTVPIEQIRSLSCDIESHTSVALARIILQESFGIHPEFVASTAADAELLIGDKVIARMQSEMQNSQARSKKSKSSSAFQLDLGSAWRKLTSLPFLFACWTARRDADLGDVPQRLLAARKRGMENIPRIVQRDAIPLGWPAEVARKYLTEHLSYEVSPRQIQAVELFHQLAARHGLIPSPRPLEIWPFNVNGTL